jgi:hypothetical protein
VAAVLGLGLSTLTGLTAGQAAASPERVEAAALRTAAPGADSDALWTPVSGRVRPSEEGAKRRVNPSASKAYALDAAALDATLDRAPAEEAGRAGTLVSLPAPTGELVDFRIVDSPIMEPGLAADHPEITTYAGTAVGSAASLRLDVTPMGLHASVRGDGASWYIDPAFNGDDSVYLSYLGTSLPAPERGLVEPELNEPPVGEVERRVGEEQGAPVVHRTYRLALLTDPSYARYFGTENVLAEKVTLMNRVNQIYNDDFAVRLMLIDETDALNIDTDEKAFGPDGGCGSAGCFTPTSFTNGCGGALLNRNQVAIGQLVGAASYDIGHVALGINGGGIAQLNGVGNTGKARGCTGLPQPEGDFMAIDYVAHEMGHQFGGNHTFNGTQGACGGNKAAPSVEPGSGSSVMAYAGICDQDDLQPHTDPYFSQWSQREMGAYITSTPAPVNERQTFGLNGFDTDGESFTLTYDGRTTAPIVRGTTYTLAGIDAAVTAILPEGGQVSVRGFNNSGTLTDTGFQLTFDAPGSTTNVLAGTDVAPFTYTGVDGGSTAVVGETDQGGPAENGGFVQEVSTNRTPVVTAPAPTSIPLRTPFALTGSATDADGDQMVYLWEQTDRGAGTGTSLVDQVKTNGPIFRVFGTYADVTPAATLRYNSPGENLADGNPTRTFPDLEQILANNTNAQTGLCPAAPADATAAVPVPTIDCFSEWLPTSDYAGSVEAGNNAPVALNFRFTARDLAPDAGGYSTADTTVLVDTTAGPFLVSSKNGPAAAVAGRTEEVRWAVNGTDKASLAPNVRISLSTDGGRTFPTVLAESTPNDGAHPVTWPNTGTDTARIKIEAVGNVFFDVNNTDFEIVARPETSIAAGPADDAIVVTRDVAFTLASTVPGASFACALDGEEVDCADGTAAFEDLLPGTYELTATSSAGGYTDASGVSSTFTVPVDDVSLARVRKTWDRRTAGSAYNGTLTTTRVAGATLAYRVTDATSLALVAPTTAGGGSVRVSLDGERLAFRQLTSGTLQRKQVIPVADFDVPTSGTVRIRTVFRKPVRIDGLAVVSPTA